MLLNVLKVVDPSNSIIDYLFVLLQAIFVALKFEEPDPAT